MTYLLQKRGFLKGENKSSKYRREHQNPVTKKMYLIPQVENSHGPLITLQSKILQTISTGSYVLLPKLSCCINHYNSLFLASSHNLINPDFCIKYLKMPTMIPVQITQTQEENGNPTMAFPHWDDFLDPQLPEIPEIPEKKFTQKTLMKFYDFNKKSAPTHECVQVNEHVRGDKTLVPAHMRKVKTKPESKTNNCNKRTGKAKAKPGAFPRMPGNYKHKGDYQASFSCHLEMQLALSRGIKK